MKTQSRQETQPIIDAIYKHQQLLDDLELQLLHHYALTAEGKKGSLSYADVIRYEKQTHDSRNIIKQLEGLL